MSTVASSPDVGVAPTPEPATPARGRPREFDEDDVLERVIDLFWATGFEATSISEIVEATGLNKSSLYNTFGSKDDLFTAAIDRYLTGRAAMMFAVVGDGTAGLDDLLELLDYLEAEVATERGRMGCFAVNTTTELGLRDERVVELSRRLRSDIRQAVGAALGRAETANEIQPGTAGQRTETLLAFLLSLTVIARGGASTDEVDGQFTAMRAQIEDWRLP
jgi:TetR/AcrR family transcriptional repressor of nem operon